MKRIIVALFIFGVVFTYTELVHSQVVGATKLMSFPRVNGQLGATKYNAVGDSLEALTGFGVSTAGSAGLFSVDVVWKHGTTSNNTASYLYIIPGGRGPGWGTPAFKRNVGFETYSVPAASNPPPATGSGPIATPKLKPITITAVFTGKWTGAGGSGTTSQSVKFTEGAGGGGGSPSGDGDSGVPIIRMGE